MRNPAQTLDASLLQEEPLRSFLRDVGSQYCPNDPIFKEKRRFLVNELKKEENVEAVKTWVDFAFPANQAPLGKTAPQGHTAVDMFANFFWLFYLDVQHKRRAKKYIGRERVKLGWPENFAQTLEGPSKHVTKNETPELDNRDGIQNSRKPINPSTSHVMINTREVPPHRHSELKYEDTAASSINSRRHHNPHLNPIQPSSKNNWTANSWKNMDPATATIDNRSLSPLTECESDVSAPCETPPIRVQQKRQQKVPTKRKHPPVAGNQVEMSKSRRVSARLSQMQSSATTDLKRQTILNPRTASEDGASKINPSSSDSLPITQSHAPPNADSMSVKREPVDVRIKDIPSSSRKQHRPNATFPPPPPPPPPPPVKMWSGSQLPKNLSFKKKPLQNQSSCQDSTQVSISTPPPKTNAVRPGATSGGEVMHGIEGGRVQREKLRPRMSISSGSLKPGLLSKRGTSEQGQNPIVPSSVNVVTASKGPQSPPKLKRKWSGNFELDKSSSTKEPTTFQVKKEHASLYEQPASKKLRKGVPSSLKGSRPLDNNRRQSQRLRNGHNGSIVPPPSEDQLKLEREASPDVAMEKSPSPVLLRLEKKILEPTGEKSPTDADISGTSLPTTDSIISHVVDNASCISLEITGGIKEEDFGTSQISVSQSPPIVVPHFQKDVEEVELALYNDLSSSGESSNHFIFPEDHPNDFYQLPKAPLRILPPIWAESRQELCETFDWFRSYQGGVYHAHNVAKGYLLSGFPASRDRFEHGGRLIISHGGGKAESIHSHRGRFETQPASDQLAQDKSVRALYDNYLNHRPLALVMDDRYALFPYDMGAKNVTYAVLGFYTIAEAWAEYQPSNNESGRVIRYKFAFRWCDDQGPPWWEQEEEIYALDVDNKLACLSDSGCNDQISSGTEETAVPQTERPFLSAPSPATAQDVVFREGESVGNEGEQQVLPSPVFKECYRKKCSSCSRMFPQVFSFSWTCLNPECHKFWRRGDGQLLPDSLSYSNDFLQLGPSKPIPLGFGKLEPTSALDLPFGNVTTYASTRGFHCYNCGRLSCRYQWEKWHCMNSACQASLKISCPPRTAASLLYQNPVTLFKDYFLNPISDIIQLPQASFKHDKGRGHVQTFVLPHEYAKIHHIQSGNFLGRQEADSIFLDYQDQATSGSLKFRRRPMRAHKCRGALLTNYFSQNSGEPYKYVGGDANTVPFESAPGAVVRARDLIQKRVMQSLQIPAHFNEVLSAAYMERQKMAFHSDDEVGLGPLVAGLSLGSPALMHFRLHAKHDIDRERRGILLSIVLRHGDVLVMDGAAVQEYYEHTVVPTNFRIAATARQIGANHA